MDSVTSQVDQFGNPIMPDQADNSQLPGQVDAIANPMTTSTPPMELPPEDAGYIPPAAPAVPMQPAVPSPLDKIAAEIGQRQAQQEASALNGYMREQDVLAKKRQAAMDESIKMFDSKDKELDAIDPNRFWNSQSTLSKVLGAVAIAAGEVGKALTKSDKNSALEIINNAINKDIDAQKLTNEQKALRQSNALKRVQLEIEKFGELSKDSERKFSLAQLAAKLQEKRDEIKLKTAQSAAVSAQVQGQGLTADEANRFLNEEQRNRAVTLPDGRIKLATNKDASEKLNSIIKDSGNAMDLAKQLSNQVKTIGITDKLNPLSGKVAKVDQLSQALVGALRVPITGPGVLNEQEYERLMKRVIGDPTSLTTTPGLVEARMNGLNNLLRSAQNSAYKNAGVAVNMTKADQMRIALTKKGYMPEEVDSAIERLAKQDPSYK